MNAKMLTILAFSCMVALGALSAKAADGRGTSPGMMRLDPVMVEDGSAEVDPLVVMNESAAIRRQIAGNARSTH